MASISTITVEFDADGMEEFAGSIREFTQGVERLEDLERRKRQRARMKRQRQRARMRMAMRIIGATLILLAAVLILRGCTKEAEPEEITKPRESNAVQEAITVAPWAIYLPYMMETNTAAGAEAFTREMLIAFTEEIGGLYDISPELLQAMAERESTINPDAVNGDCKGIMQVSEHWHKDRMERLGVSDIFDPYGNILVAADFLTELREENPDPVYMLMRYNMEINTANELYNSGKYTDYATGIIARAAELEKEHGK